MPKGIFDPSANPLGWFDETEKPVGWFSREFLDDGVAPTAVVAQGGDPAPLPHLGLVLGASAGNNGVGAASGAGTASALSGSVGSAAGTGTATGLRGSVGSASGVGTAAAIRGAIGAAAGVGAASALMGSIGSAAGVGAAAGVSPAAAVLDPWPLPSFSLGASAVASNDAIAASVGAGVALALSGSVASAAGTTTAAAVPGYIAAAAGAATAVASSSSTGMYPMPLPSLTLGASGVASVTSGVGSASGSAAVNGHGGQAATILWSDITGEDGYRIKWGLASGGPYTNSADVAADVTSYTIVGLEYLTNYYVVIYGLLGGVEQDPSAEIVINVGAAGSADAAGSSTAFGVSGAIYEFRSVGVGTATAIRGYIASASGSSTVNGIRGATGASTGDGNAAGTSTAQALIGSKFFASGVAQTGDGAAAGYGMKSGAIARSDGVGYGNFVPNVTGVGSAAGTSTANAVGVVVGGADTVFGGVPGYWPQPGQNKEWLRKVAREVAGPARTLPQRAQEAVAEVAAGYVGPWDQARAETELRAALLAQSIKYQAVYFDLLARIYEQTLADAIARQAIAGIEQAQSQAQLEQAIAAEQRAAWERDEDEAITLLLLAA